MTPRRAQAITVALALIFIAMAAIPLFLLAEPLGAVRWGIGLPFLAIGIVNLFLAPRFSRETLPSDTEFRPLGEHGQPVVGSAHVQRMALVLDRELRETPHQVETSPNAVRVSYDSGTFFRPGELSFRQFRWRTTLTPLPADPHTFVRLDQEAARTAGLGWGKATVSGGMRWGAAARVTVGGGQPATVETVTTVDISDAVKAAVRESGVRMAVSTLTLVGLVNAALGILIAVAVPLSLAFS